MTETKKTFIDWLEQYKDQFLSQSSRPTPVAILRLWNSQDETLGLIRLPKGCLFHRVFEKALKEWSTSMGVKTPQLKFSWHKTIQHHWVALSLIEQWTPPHPRIQKPTRSIKVNEPFDRAMIVYGKEEEERS